MHEPDNQPDRQPDTPATNPYQAPTATTAAPDDELLAGRGTRLAAVLIDAVIQMAVVIPIMWVTGAWAQAMSGQAALNMEFAITWFLVGEAAFLAVQGWLLFTRQQTIGKMLLNIRIVGMQDTRVPPGRLYGARYLLFHLMAQVPLFNLVLLVDALMIFRRDRRCLHDLIAGTQVVDAPAGS
jgi:uncharacterized RDD family membrane protein YckC